MPEINECTLKMKHGFMKKWESGMSIKEIAKYFKVSRWTVYHYLGEIAEEAGVSRDSLLVRHVSERSPNTIAREPLEAPLGLEEFHDHLLDTLDNIHNLRSTIEKEIQRQDCFLQAQGGMS